MQHINALIRSVLFDCRFVLAVVPFLLSVALTKVYFLLRSFTRYGICINLYERISFRDRWVWVTHYETTASILTIPRSVEHAENTVIKKKRKSDKYQKAFNTCRGTSIFNFTLGCFTNIHQLIHNSCISFKESLPRIITARHTQT